MADVIMRLKHTAAQIDEHIDSEELHLQEGERTKYTEHLNAAVLHTSAEEKTQWNLAAETAAENKEKIDETTTKLAAIITRLEALEAAVETEIETEEL